MWKVFESGDDSIFARGMEVQREGLSMVGCEQPAQAGIILHTYFRKLIARRYCSLAG